MANATNTLISIVIPVKNEEQNILPLYQALENLRTDLAMVDLEYVFVDDGSVDGSYELLESLQQKNDAITLIRLSRSYGFQQALFVGYANAQGDAAVELDCDLQDPPSLIPQFIEYWQQGYKIVYGIRRRRSENPCLTFARKCFYRLIHKISDSDLPKDAGDFMLIDRKVMDLLKRSSRTKIYIRGLVFSFGFDRMGVEYDRNARHLGKSKFNVFSLMDLAIDGIVSQSIVPIRMASVFGFVVTMFSVVLGLVYLFQKIFSRNQRLRDGPLLQFWC
ncbi:MAG: glycosyltransferase family 2 protein [Bdellovibrionota bacterium]